MKEKEKKGDITHMIMNPGLRKSFCMFLLNQFTVYNDQFFLRLNI